MGQAAVAIPEKLYFKIGEVCEIVGVQAHVLRYWETEFTQLSPQKNRSGQRSYRRRDVETALRIKDLLYEDLYTIAGARKKLQLESRAEAPKLKVIRPEPPEDAVSAKADNAPGLFDEPMDDADEITLDDRIESAVETVRAVEKDLGEDQREALKNLAQHLLELRTMLKNGR